MAGRIAYYGGIVTDGLVLHLDAAKKDSYSGQGTVWNDISGRRNNGTLVNGPTFDSSNGGSIVFDGVNDRISYSFIPPISNDFCISMWINKTSAKSTAAIISIGGILWQVDDNYIYYWVNVISGRISHPFYTVLNRWYYMSVVQTGGIGYLYINSQLVKTSSNGSPNLTYGNSAIGSWGTSGRFWLGKISQVKIYNRALSQQEILQNFNATKGRYGL